VKNTVMIGFTLMMHIFFSFLKLNSLLIKEMFVGSLKTIIFNTISVYDPCIQAYIKRIQDPIHKMHKQHVYLLWCCANRSRVMWRPQNGLHIIKLAKDSL
jgi:hypothetical protein